MLERMRVGVSTLGADGGRSGISQYVLRLLDAWRRLDLEIDIEIITLRSERQLFAPRDNGFGAIALDDTLRAPIINIAWHQLALPLLCRKRSYDLLFLPAGNRRLPLHVPCPTVATVHDLASIHVAQKYDPARAFYVKRVLPALIRRVNRVLTVSESSKRDIVSHCGITDERVSVTPLGVDHALYHRRDLGAARSRVAHTLQLSTPYLVYVSRVEHPGKNHIRLIRAFERVKKRLHLPHQLVFAGSDWNRAAEVHEAAKHSEVASDIRFLGFVATECLPDLYAAADAAVFPSLFEGFGLPVLEAMASGTPVACSNVSSLPEVGGDAVAYFDPEDVEQIASVLEKILGQEQLRHRLREAGLARSRAYTWEKTAMETWHVIERAALESRRGTAKPWSLASGEGS